MLKVIMCSCGGADRTAREVLRKGGVDNPLEFPLTSSKAASIKELEAFPPRFKELPQFKALYEHVKQAGRFVIIIGYSADPLQLKWADVARGSIKENLDGEILVEYFKAI